MIETEGLTEIMATIRMAITTTIIIIKILPMKNTMTNTIKNTLPLSSIILSSAFLHSCASVSGAGVADYNKDGVISSAEASQYHRQKDIEDRNVYTESLKRRNATNTVRDTRDAASSARSVKNIFQNW